MSSGSLAEGRSLPIRLLSPRHEGQSTGRGTVTKQQGGLSYLIHYTADEKGLIKSFLSLHVIRAISIRAPWLLKTFLELFSCVGADV